MGAQSETSSAIQLEPTQRCAMRVFLGSWVTSQLATNRLSTTIYASRGVLKVGGSLERAATPERLERNEHHSYAGWPYCPLPHYLFS